MEKELLELFPTNKEDLVELWKLNLNGLKNLRKEFFGTIYAFLKQLEGKEFKQNLKLPQLDKVIEVNCDSFEDYYQYIEKVYELNFISNEHYQYYTMDELSNPIKNY